MAAQSVTTLRRRLAEAHAETAFIAYCHMGGARSLAKLADDLRATGVLIRAVKTYEQWSSRHDWQERVIAFDREAARQLAGERAVVAAGRQAQHQRIGEAFLGIVTRSVARYAETHADGTPVLILDAREMADLARAGEALERRALGLDSDRTSIRVQAMQEVWQEMQIVFAEAAASSTDAAERQRLWERNSKERVTALLVGDVGDDLPDWLQAGPPIEIDEDEEGVLIRSLAAYREQRELPDFSHYPPLPPPGQYAEQAEQSE